MTEEIESFTWRGQVRYKCPRIWDGGARCQYNHYDLKELGIHMGQAHGVSAKAAGPPKVKSPILDERGNNIVRAATDEEVPLEYRGVRFKREEE